jgi:histidyl-tRNA synthetase
MSGLKAPKGTFDVLPASAAAYELVETVAGEVLGRAGYRRISTPIFESTELFSRGVGESTDIVAKEMYSFDDGGGRSMTLRPEGTASVCRAYVEHGMHKQQQPVRLWYSGPFFRHEAPQAGRHRQFHQIGAEAFGSDRPELDAESILLLSEVLEKLGVAGIRLRLGTLGSTDVRLDWREKLSAYLRQNEDRLSAEVRSRIDSNPLRAFDSSDPSTQEVMQAAPLLLDELTGDDLDHFETVKALLDAAGIHYEVDPRLVRGLDYYCRTVFEFSSDRLGAQSGVGGGGRYDGLVEMLGGQPTPAIGWAAGIERILLSSEASSVGQDSCELLVLSLDRGGLEAGFALAAQARAEGISARLEAGGRSVKAAFKHADKIGAQFVAIIDADGIQLKDLASGEQVVHPSPSVLISTLRDKITS